MLRLEFSAADLGRVRVANAPHPLWELILSINSLQSPALPARYWDWRATVFSAAQANGGTRRVLAAAASLVPASGNFPDFLTPPIESPNVDAHWDSILAFPRRQLREDLDRTFRWQLPAPRWAQALYSHGRVDGVVEILRCAEEFLIGPARDAGNLQVETDRAEYARHLLDGGTDRLLENLHPSIRWRSPVLEADYPFERTIGLGGRGLVVVPAHFCWGAPVTFIDGGQLPMLVVPGGTDGADAAGQPTLVDAAVDRLGRLLGATRARILAELSVGGSTTELAKRLNVTPAAISQHAKVLREAKLVTTARFGTSVRHALTPFGRELLDSRP